MAFYIFISFTIDKDRSQHPQELVNQVVPSRTCSALPVSLSLLSFLGLDFLVQSHADIYSRAYSILATLLICLTELSPVSSPTDPRFDLPSLYHTWGSHPSLHFTDNSQKPAAMGVSEIVTDPSLLPALQTSSETLAQCESLLSLVESVPSSTAPSEEALLAISKQQKLLFSLLARLRGLNRDAILGVRSTKQVTAEARQEIDRLHLLLQNLYYEQRHLSGEITACESYEYV